MAGKKAEFLGTTELARRAGVSTDTLRHYEAKGVIQRPPRQANGYRTYPVETLERVRTVRRALTIGFTLDELAEIMRERDRGGAPCRKVRDLAASKLESIDARLKDLVALRDQLRATLKTWDARLAKAPRNRRARLLDGLLVSDTPRRGGHPPFSTTANDKNERKNR